VTVQIKGASPYLYYPDAAVALEWLSRVLGFREVVRYVDEQGSVQEAEIAAGDTLIMLAGSRKAADGEGRGLLLIVHVDDVRAQFQRVKAAGVDADPPQEKPWGPITFNVRDPWGYQWDFWQKGKPFQQGTGGLREIRA
jgi:uncharacterized glyoxalase superfamily protein PhnB